MFEKRIPLPSQQRAASASYRFHKRKKNKKNIWHYCYNIRASAGRPFFPSDKMLRTLINGFPRIRFLRCDRLLDHDVLTVRGLEDNFFRRNTEPARRKTRRAFLRSVEACALAERPRVGRKIEEAAARFLSDCGFVNVFWNGKDVVSHTQEGHRYDGYQLTIELYRLPLQRFKKACKGSPAFFYGTALP